MRILSALHNRLFKPNYLYNVALVFLFVCTSCVFWREGSGADLASGYIAARLMDEDKTKALFAHHPEFFHMVDNQDWNETAATSECSVFLHPYVQIPLWASCIKPMATRLPFSAFNSLFIFLSAIATVGFTLILLQHLSEKGVVPLSLALSFLWLLNTHPYCYAMQLTQTHPLFIPAILAALVFEKKKDGPLPGLLLALAAIVKITPGFIVIYWCFLGHWRSVAWFSGAMIFLVSCSVLMAGLESNLEFLQQLKRISNMLILSWNNESFAALCMKGPYLQAPEGFRMQPLSAGLKIAGTLAMILFISLAGWLRKQGAELGATASIVFIAMTCFAPLAWSHYYIILLVPLVHLINRALRNPMVWLISIPLIYVTLSPLPILTRPWCVTSLVALVACIAFAFVDIAKNKSSQPPVPALNDI
ncbi:glycosyltransferase family 87 protein [Pontiellaceae bacterium B12219]|nr:glycosyltransferase family 87 protein [Pontiellaceae bacterium B12219]